MGSAERVPEIQRIHVVRQIQHRETRRYFRVVSAVQHLREREIEHSARTNAAPIEIDEFGAWTPDQVGWIIDFEWCAAFVPHRKRGGKTSTHALVGHARRADMPLIVIRREAGAR